MIKSCLFSYNKATSNTLEMMYADGTIQASTFLNNQATKFSENIFTGFNTLSIISTSFTDTRYAIADAESVVNSKITTGAFI